MPPRTSVMVALALLNSRAHDRLRGGYNRAGCGGFPARICAHIHKDWEGAGLAPPSRAQFDALRGPTGALLIGDAEIVAEKILYVNDVLGGLSRITFQMGVSALAHQKMSRSIELLGTRVAPLVGQKLTAKPLKLAMLCEELFRERTTAELEHFALNGFFLTHTPDVGEPDHRRSHCLRAMR